MPNSADDPSMPYIKTIPQEEATGLLKREYDTTVGRAGWIWNIVSIMSQNAPVLQASISLYGALMHGPSPLSRGRRELLDMVFSARNHCVY